MKKYNIKKASASSFFGLGSLEPLSQKTKKKAKFMVYDIEAVSIEKNTDFRMVGLKTEDEYLYFTSLDTFLNTILQDKYAGYTIYGHYGGKYDVLFILEAYFANPEKIKNGWQMEKIIDSGGSIISLSFVKEKKRIKRKKECVSKLRITFADSYRIFLTSLAKLAIAFKLPEKFEHNHNEEFELTEENINYNKRDCEILYSAIQIFYEKYAAGIGCKLTIASAAMAIYRKNYQPEPILNLAKPVENLVRQSYAGGRTEVFKTKTQPDEILTCSDINSLYPSVMLQDMPIGAASFTTKFKENKIGFYSCDCEVSDDVDIPLLYVKENGLKFMKGNFSGVYSSAEIKEAIKQGVRIKINYGYYFLSKAKLFKDYVQHYYELKNTSKQNGDETGYMISKIFLNSLYGKFAERRNKKTIVYNNNFKDATLKKQEVYNLDFGLFLENNFSKAKHIIPSISAYITSLARIVLYNYLMKTGKNLYYCDTDSVYYTGKSIPNSNKLGKMKIEYYCKNAEFNLPKTYQIQLCDKNGKDMFNKEGKPIIINKNKGFEKNKDNGSIKLLGFKSAIKEIGNIDDEYIFLKHGFYNKETKAHYDKRIIIDVYGNTQALNYNSYIAELETKRFKTKEEKIQEYVNLNKEMSSSELLALAYENNLEGYENNYGFRKNEYKIFKDKQKMVEEYPNYYDEIMSGH